MIYELNHFGIIVKDLNKSLEFYEQVLGGKIVYKGLIPANNTHVVYLNICGGLIELLHRADAGRDETFGINHIAFLSNDLDADYARLVGEGYEGLVAPKIAGTGVGRLCFLNDPNGVRVELLQRDVKMRDELVTHSIIKSFDHFSIGAADRKAALKFYQTDLGMNVLKVDGGEPHFLDFGFDVLQLDHQTASSAPDTHFNHFALRVDDVSAALSAFSKQNVLVDQSEVSLAHPSGGHLGIIRDPDGVKIQLLDRPDMHNQNAH